MQYDFIWWNWINEWIVAYEKRQGDPLDGTRGAGVRLFGAAAAIVGTAVQPSALGHVANAGFFQMIAHVD